MITHESVNSFLAEQKRKVHAAEEVYQLCIRNYT
jgi:hypothetical protein